MIVIDNDYLTFAFTNVNDFYIIDNYLFKIICNFPVLTSILNHLFSSNDYLTFRLLFQMSMFVL